MNILAGEIEYTTKVRLTADDINDILATALEGGIGYWAVLDDSTTDWEETSSSMQDASISDVITKMLFEGKKIRFIGADKDDATREWFLDMNKFIFGCKRFEEEVGSVKRRLLDSSFDADDADMLIQFALFNEIIFG